MWKPGSLIFDSEQAAVVLNDADNIIATEGIYKYVTLAGGDTVRVPDTENGRLFAAAPDMFNALHDILLKADRQRIQLGALLCVHPETPAIRTALTENALIINAARAAIAKATEQG